MIRNGKYLLGLMVATVAASFVTPVSASEPSSLIQVSCQPGTNTSRWIETGVWVVGNRKDQKVTDLDIRSCDGGSTLCGWMRYAGEGPIRFKAKRLCGNTYAVENQWGKPSEKWNPAGMWLLGGRTDRYLTELKIKSADEGRTYTGTATYRGESPMRFRSSPASGTAYLVETRYGNSWRPGGVWIIGARKQPIAEIMLTGDGKGLSGTVKYDGEGPIGFRGDFCGFYMNVKNQCCGSNSPWRSAGTWVLGSSPCQKVTAIYAISDMENTRLLGNVTFDGRNPVEFQARRIEIN